MTALLVLFLLRGPLLLQAEWTAQNDLPFERVHAIAQSGGEYFLGGLRGLCRGKPGQWRRIDDRPVREVLSDGQALWVLFGDGSVDKLVPKDNRLYYDVLHSAAKRPWASSMALTDRSTLRGRTPGIVGSGACVLFGGQGGWILKSRESLYESYPKELRGQVVTAPLLVGEDLWVGTQKDGLHRYRKGKSTRFGFGAGLPDLWITALAFSDGKLYVGVADGGVAVYSGGRFVALDCPGNKVRKIAFFQGRLAVGAMDGAWVRDGRGWQRLSDEETTALAPLGGRLLVGTPRGVLWWR